MFGGIQSFVRKESYDWWMMLIMGLPGELGSKVRLSLLPFKLVEENVQLLLGGMVKGMEGLSIVAHSQIKRFCHFVALGSI